MEKIPQQLAMKHRLGGKCFWSWKREMGRDEVDMMCFENEIFEKCDRLKKRNVIGTTFPYNLSLQLGVVLPFLGLK
jgi:hypothetical protein